MSALICDQPHVSILFPSFYFWKRNCFFQKFLLCGALERSHAPLMDFIRAYSEKYNDWDRLVPFATFTYNTSVHSATNFTPFELVYGWVARFPIRIPDEEKLRSYNLYLRDLITRLDDMKVIAGEREIAGKMKTKNRNDQKTKKFCGDPGDYVWVLSEPCTSNFDSYYNRPLKIVEIVGKNVILELPNGKRIRKHMDKLMHVPRGPEEKDLSN